MTRQLYVSMSVQQPSLDKQNTMEIKEYEADKIDRDKQHLPTTCSWLLIFIAKNVSKELMRSQVLFRFLYFFLCIRNFCFCSWFFCCMQIKTVSGARCTWELNCRLAGTVGWQCLLFHHTDKNQLAYTRDQLNMVLVHSMEFNWNVSLYHVTQKLYIFLLFVGLALWSMRSSDFNGISSLLFGIPIALASCDQFGHWLIDELLWHFIFFFSIFSKCFEEDLIEIWRWRSYSLTWMGLIDMRSRWSVLTRSSSWHKCVFHGNCMLCHSEFALHNANRE